MGLLAVLVALLVARAALPRRVVLVQLADSGGSALAASRSDLLLVAGLVVVGLAIAWLVASVAVLLTPARHLLVPHAEHWKAPSRRPVLRARLLRHVSLGVAVVWWSLALQLVATVLAQRGGPLAAWWIPAAISTVTVLVLVVGGLVLLLTAWSPTARSATDPAAGSTSAARAASGGGAGDRVSPLARSRTGPVAARVPTPATERAAKPVRPPRSTSTRDTSSWNPDPPSRGRSAGGGAATGGTRPSGAGTGAARGAGEQGAGRPARPYQPLPKRPGTSGGTGRGTDGRTPRG